jgi:hypothetical protein
LAKSDSSLKERDVISSLAISLSGLSYLAFVFPCPPFYPNVDHHHIDLNNIAITFLARRIAQLELDEFDT